MNEQRYRYMKSRADTANKFLSNIYKLTSDEKAYIFINFLFFFKDRFWIKKVTLTVRACTNYPDNDSN